MDSKDWIFRQKNDYYCQKSQRIGAICRSYFKLEEINEKYRIIISNSHILDLGACPGSWTQYCYKFTKNITSIDCNNNWKFTNIKLIQQDILDWKSEQQFNTILSDISPNLSGNSTQDRMVMEGILDMILNVCVTNLEIGGSIVCKIFTHNQDYVSKFKSIFKRVKLYRPDACRKKSSEIYIIGFDKYIQNTDK